MQGERDAQAGEDQGGGVGSRMHRRVQERGYYAPGPRVDVPGRPSLVPHSNYVCPVDDAAESFVVGVVDHFRVRRRDRAGDVIHEYRLVA